MCTVCDCNGKFYTNTHRDAYTYSNAYTDCNYNANGNSHSDAYALRDVDPDGDGNTGLLSALSVVSDEYGDGHSDRDRHGHGHRDTNSPADLGHPDGQPDGHECRGNADDDGGADAKCGAGGANVEDGTGRNPGVAVSLFDRTDGRDDDRGCGAIRARDRRHPPQIHHEFSLRPRK